MEFLKEILRNIRRKKMRSFLTVFGIAIGVLSVVVISILGEVGKSSIDGELESVGGSGITVQIDKTKTDKKFAEQQLSITSQDSNVKSSMPVELSYTNTKFRNKEEKCAAFGVTQELDKIISIRLLHGRLLTSSDIKQNAKVCVIDESFAKILYGRTNIVGKEISFQIQNKYQPYKVVGVVSSGGNILQGALGSYIPAISYLPITAIQDGAGYNSLMIRLKDSSQSDSTATRITGKLNASLGVTNAITVQNMAAQKEQLSGVMVKVTWLLSVIAAISLLVAGLSIMTVMLVSVHERTREIGIKKAIGASRKRILIEFITESFLLCFLGSLSGLLLGILGMYLGCRFFNIPFAADSGMIAFYFLISVSIGVLFGVYPANKAAKLKPVDALSANL